MCGKPFRPATWSRPSRVLWIVTQPVWEPLKNAVFRLTPFPKSEDSISLFLKKRLTRLMWWPGSDYLAPLFYLSTSKEQKWSEEVKLQSLKFHRIYQSAYRFIGDSYLGSCWKESYTVYHSIKNYNLQIASYKLSKQNLRKTGLF